MSVSGMLMEVLLRVSQMTLVSSVGRRCNLIWEPVNIGRKRWFLSLLSRLSLARGVVALVRAEVCERGLRALGSVK